METDRDGTDKNKGVLECWRNKYRPSGAGVGVDGNGRDRRDRFAGADRLGAVNPYGHRTTPFGGDSQCRDLLWGSPHRGCCWLTRHDDAGGQTTERWLHGSSDKGERLCGFRFVIVVRMR